MIRKLFGSKRPLPSQEFQKILTADDLDDLLKFAMEVQQLSENDSEISKRIIQEWKDYQAVYNLLIHNRFIPNDLRINSLIKGLSQMQNLPLVMAATVGVQQLGTKNLNDQEKSKIKNLLLILLQSDVAPLAMRASISIREYLAIDDIIQLASYVHHKDESVRRNIVSAIAKLVGKDQALNYITDHKGINPKDKEQIVSIIMEHQEKAKENKVLKHFGIDMPLLGYIPNLREFV